MHTFGMRAPCALAQPAVRGRTFAFFLFVCGVLFAPASGVAGNWDDLIGRLADDGFSRQWLQQIFERPEMQFDRSVMVRKMKTLYAYKFGEESVRRLQRRLSGLGYQPGGADGKVGPKTRRAIRWFQQAHGLPVDGEPSDELLQMALKEGKKAPLDIKVPPARKGPLVYRTIMTPTRLEEAGEFLAENQELLLILEKAYGIPPEIAVGILTVESRLGNYLGEQSAFLTLASMAACDDFACVAPAFADESITRSKQRWLERRTAQKARWAYNECRSLLSYAQQSGKDPLNIPGSVYGAIGIAQFMPSQALRYGVDGNADGVVDLFHLEDAVFSMGNYLRANGWRGRMESVRRQRRAIYNYNRSRIYVNTVLAVADYLEDG